MFEAITKKQWLVILISMSLIIFSTYLLRPVRHLQQNHHTAVTTNDDMDEIEREVYEELLNVFNKINADYRHTAFPLFKKACFDCHSRYTIYPWYHYIPVVKQIIDRDIATAKLHLDMSNDFPFYGHASPEEDLEAIKSVIENESMPPFRYEILHPEAKLTENERSIIKDWTNRTQKILSDN